LALKRRIHFPTGRGARKRHLPWAFVEATVSRLAYNPKSVYFVRLTVVVDNVGDSTWHLQGKLSKLDWSCVPEDLRVFVDKPSGGDAIVHEAAKAVRIVKGLEDVEIKPTAATVSRTD
jgi:hypothetical protein